MSNVLAYFVKCWASKANNLAPGADMHLFKRPLPLLSAADGPIGLL